MTVDLISRPDRRVAQSQHHVFEALVLTSDHPKRDRMAKRMRRYAVWVATSSNDMFTEVFLLLYYLPSRLLTVLLAAFLARLLPRSDGWLARRHPVLHPECRRLRDLRRPHRDYHYSHKSLYRRVCAHDGHRHQNDSRYGHG